MSGIPERPHDLTLRGADVPSKRAVHPRSRLMRLQLLAVLGLSSAVLQACDALNPFDDKYEFYDPYDDYDCGDNVYETMTVVADATLASEGETCSDTVDFYELRQTEEQAAEGPNLDWYYGYQCEPAELVEQNGLICTYTLACEEWNCCGYGRPYLDEEGDAVAAGHCETPEWNEPVVVELSDLSAEEREALTAYWLKNAAAEHSSVAGFHRFALDLLAHGAPPELVRRAGEAAAQEITHAIDCFSLASAYAGRRLGPEALDLGSAAPVARSLAELAAWTVRDGAVGETIAAYLAAEALEGATDPEVRRTLEVVVRDETAHAELAWETLVWAIDVGGDEVREAVRAVFNTVAHPHSKAEFRTAGTVAHGLLPADLRDAAAARCIDEVLKPVMASLLARELAA